MSGILIYNQPHLLSKILYEFGGLCSKSALCIKKEVKIDLEKVFSYHCINCEPFFLIHSEKKIIFGKRKFVSITREYPSDEEEEEGEEPFFESYFFKEIKDFEENFEEFEGYLMYHLEYQEIEKLEYEKRVGKLSFEERCYLTELKEDSIITYEEERDDYDKWLKQQIEEEEHLF